MSVQSSHLRGITIAMGADLNPTISAWDLGQVPWHMKELDGELENLCPILGALSVPSGRSPLPDWYPRAPLQDITNVLHSPQHRCTAGKKKVGRDKPPERWIREKKYKVLVHRVEGESDEKANVIAGMSAPFTVKRSTQLLRTGFR